MRTPLLTIGMACHTDFNGVYMTVNNLRHNHDLADCEILVIDNNPNCEEGVETKKFLNNVKEVPCRYIPYTEYPGTSQSRNYIFDQAQGEYVLVLDSHVFLIPNAIANLKLYLLDNPNTMNLFAGSLYMDDFSQVATHMFPLWRGEMWGIWASAWVDPQGNTVQTFDNQGKLQLLTIAGHPTHTPEMPWEGHETKLRELYYRPRGFPDDKPFEIPAHGLGLFATRRDGWLRFNKDFREFGGEEVYIHLKYQQAGRKVICLPFLGWQHRWYRPGGAKYTFNKLNKFRNYVLGLRELNIPLDTAITHFREAGLTEDQIQQTLKDPSKYYPSDPYPKEITEYSSRVDMFLHYKGIQRDLNQHADVLRHYASKSERVVELTKRRESTFFLLAGSPSHLYSFQEEMDPALQTLQKALSREASVKKISWHLTPHNHDTTPEIPPCELLFLDTRHTYKRLYNELKTLTPNVGKYVIVHDTQLYGQKGEDGQEGMGKAIEDFLVHNPQWYILSHTDKQYGLTVLSCIPEERPKHPITPFHPDCGPGEELKRLFRMIGITASANCGCNAKAKEMNQRGADWCLENIDNIVDFLYLEYKKRKYVMPFSRTVAKLFIRRAVRNSRKRPCK